MTYSLTSFQLAFVVLSHLVAESYREMNHSRSSFFRCPSRWLFTESMSHVQSVANL